MLFSPLFVQRRPLLQPCPSVPVFATWLWSICVIETCGRNRKRSGICSWCVVFVWTVLPECYQRTSQLDHITCQTVLCSTAIPHFLSPVTSTNSSNSQFVHLTKLTLHTSNTRRLKHSEDTGHRSTLRASLPGNGLPCPCGAEEVQGEEGATNRCRS